MIVSIISVCYFEQGELLMPGPNHDQIETNQLRNPHAKKLGAAFAHCHFHLVGGLKHFFCFPSFWDDYHLG